MTIIKVLEDESLEELKAKQALQNMKAKIFINVDTKKLK